MCVCACLCTFMCVCMRVCVCICVYVTLCCGIRLNPFHSLIYYWHPIPLHGQMRRVSPLLSYNLFATVYFTCVYVVWFHPSQLETSCGCGFQNLSTQTCEKFCHFVCFNRFASEWHWLVAANFCANCQYVATFQAKRLGALNKFKTKERSILIATDVASRWGLVK